MNNHIYDSISIVAAICGPIIRNDYRNHYVEDLSWTVRIYQDSNFVEISRNLCKNQLFLYQN